MIKTLTVYQIYFKEEQKSLLEPEFLPYFNDNCTPFFESSVISNIAWLVDKSNDNYTGVVSYQLRDKIGDLMKNKWKGNIANTSRKDFTPLQFREDLFNMKPDAMSFQRHPSHDPVTLADKYHPNFSKLFKYIMGAVGYNWNPTVFENVFYCNFFVAKNYWLYRYNQEMLAPAMAIIENMPEAWANSGYFKKLPPELAQAWGKPELKHYPYHSFLCERMFSFFCHLHNLKCLHY